jgi:hypothetical protein
MGENEVSVDRQSGKIYWHSEFGDNDEKLPDDIDDEKYIAIPASKSAISVRLLSWISVVRSYPTTATKFAKFSIEEALTPIQGFACGGAPSNGGTIFRQGRGSGFARVVRGERERPSGTLVSS